MIAQLLALWLLLRGELPSTYFAQAADPAELVRRARQRRRAAQTHRRKRSRT